MAEPWVLAIDFGTSYTVAAVRVGDRNPEVIDIGGSIRLPSVILAEDPAHIVVGQIAEELSSAHPASTLRTPKNRLGDAAPVVLGGRPYQVELLVAALLRTVYDQAVERQGGPPREVRLTHPAMWNRPRLNRLVEAASKAGIANPVLVPEPEAAAMAYASEVGVPDGGYVAIYDLGGGTFDSAVVSAQGDNFHVIGRPSGDSSIGGELFDELLTTELGSRLDAASWDAIQVGNTLQWRQTASILRNAARRAKETLSSHPYADVVVPLPTGITQLRVTREEYEELIEPYIVETVDVLGRCIANAGISPDQLSAIYLVGGTSRTPIVARIVGESFGSVPVSRRGDPKTSTAFGATLTRPTATTAAHADVDTEDAAARTADQPLALGVPRGEALAPPTPDPTPATPDPPPAPTPRPAPGEPITTPLPPPQPQPTNEQPRRRRSAAILAIFAVVALVAVLLVVLLSGGGDDSESISGATTSPTSSRSATSAATTAPGTTTASPATTAGTAAATSPPASEPTAAGAPATPVAQHRDDLGINFGFGSFVVAFGAADYRPDEGVVVLEGTASNRSSLARSTGLDGRVMLLDGGNAYLGSLTFGGEVPPGADGAIQLTFALTAPDGAGFAPFSFDTAELWVGDGYSVGSRIRLLDGSGVDHEPNYLGDVDAVVEATTARFTVDELVVVWGTAGLAGNSARPGEAYLEVHATYEAKQGTVFAYRELRLVLPDGTVSAAMDSDPFDPILSAGTDTGQGSGRFWFSVPEPIGGTYKLRFQDGEAEFDVPDLEPTTPPVADLGCEPSVRLADSRRSDVTFRAGASTFHVCSMTMDGTDLVVSTRATNAFVGNSPPSLAGLAVRVGDATSPAFTPVSTHVPAREGAAANVVLRFSVGNVPLADGAFVIGGESDVQFEVPLEGSGAFHVPQSFDLDVPLDVGYGKVLLRRVRVQTALDSRQAKVGTYVLELDLDVWNETGGHIFLSRTSSLAVPDGTSVDPTTSGSKDFDLQIAAETQVHGATFVYEVLGEPGGTYSFTVQTDSGPVTASFDLPEVQFSPG